MVARVSVAPSVVLSRWRTVALALLVVPPFVVRLWLIRHCPEPDTDAPGHLGIARALLSDPTNVALHWVWLPAYHFLLAALLFVGFNGETIRVFNCALAALIPIVVLRYAESTGDRAAPGPARFVPWMAAAFCAVSPLINLLGTSAQQETLFTLLVVGAVWSVDRRRFVLAGAILAVASLIRYEVWGAAVLLLGLRMFGEVPAVVERLPVRLARAFRIPLVVALPSVVAVGAWLFAHKVTQGEWLGFLRELYRYTHAQRESLHRTPLWFPLDQPLYVFGWILGLLAVLGMRRAFRPSHVIPIGIYLFLLGAYAFKGALGSARYYESLTPFVALAAAEGACALGARQRWMTPAVFVAASFQLVSLSAQLCRWTWPGVGDTEASVAGPPHGPG